MRKVGLAIGALASAALASACCIGPALLFALGIGSVAATAAAALLEPYRPLFLALAVVLLAGAFWQARKRAAVVCAVDGACAPAAQSGRRAAGLGALALGVVVLGAFPIYSAYLASRSAGATPSVAPGARTAAVVSLQVSNITCESCVAHIQQALAAVPDVLGTSVDAEHGAVVVRFKAGQVRPEQLIQTLTRVGYPARIAGR